MSPRGAQAEGHVPSTCVNGARCPRTRLPVVTRHCTHTPGRRDCFQATVTIRDSHAHIVDPHRCAQFPPRCLCVQRHGACRARAFSSISPSVSCGSLTRRTVATSSLHVVMCSLHRAQACRLQSRHGLSIASALRLPCRNTHVKAGTSRGALCGVLGTHAHVKPLTAKP